MPCRNPGGDTWRCDNPACLAWTWVATSRERCFLCKCAAPRAARTRLGFLLAEAGPGHREVRGFVAPGDAADDRVAPARAAQPAPLPVEPRPLPGGPAGYLPPPPPQPNRWQPRGRTGAGAATYSRNPNQDFRGIDRELAASVYRQGGRAAVAKAPPLSGGPAHSPRHSQPPSGGSAHTHGGSGRGTSPGRHAHSRGAAAESRLLAAGADHGYPPLKSATECWVVQDGNAVRLGMPACLAKPPPPDPPTPPAPPIRHTSVTEAQWLEWHQQQLDALAAAEGKATARAAAAGPSSRGPARGPSPPHACSAAADGSAGMGAAPLLLEQRFVDRAALPKGVTFGSAASPTVSIDGDSPLDRATLDADAEMHDVEGDAEDPAGGCNDDDDAVGGGSATPVWPPADATLDQLEDWLDSLRRLPEDDLILASSPGASGSCGCPCPLIPPPPSPSS